MNRYVFAHALKITAPVFFGYIAIGIGFGMLLANAGYPWWLAVLSGVVMYTGSGQYFIVGQLASGASFAEIILVQFSLISKYKNAGGKKPYLIFAITDETFALVQGIEVPPRVNKISFYAVVSALDQSYWCLGSLIGAVAYTVMNRYGLGKFLTGVDFALTSLFIVLLIEQLKSSKDCVPALAGGLAAVFSVVLYKTGVFGSSNIIWFSICAALGVMLLARGPSFFAKEKILSNSKSEKLA